MPGPVGGECADPADAVVRSGLCDPGAVPVPARLVSAVAAAAWLLAGVTLGAAPTAGATPSSERGGPVAVGPDLLTVDLQPTAARSPAARAALTRVVHRLGADVRDRRGGQVELLVPAGRATAATEALLDVIGVQRVQVAAVLRPTYLPDDTRVGDQLATLRAVRVPEAWDRSRGDPAVTVAVLDTGVNLAHPDLDDAVVGRFHAVGGASSTTDVTDAFGHGTAVAGVVAAETDNGRGIAGVGFGSRLLAVKVASPDGLIYGPDLGRGIRWATDQGADVINMSLGGPSYDEAMRSAVEYAVDRGVVLVASAGNEGTRRRSYPAALPGVLSVGATDGRSRAAFSTYGDWVDVAAPGVGVLSTLASGGYGRWDGTSFAAPIVSGQAALLRAARPAASARRIVSMITTSATGVAARAFDHGRVDVRGSLDWLLGAPPSPPRATTAAPGNRAAAVAWRRPADTYGVPVDRYRVEARAPGGVWDVEASVPGSERSLTVTGLRNGVRYDLRVRAITRHGTSAPGAVADVLVGVPTRPRAVTVDGGPGSLQVTWQRPEHVAAGVDAYRVQWRPVGSSAWAKVDVAATTRSVVRRGLVDGRRYEARVLAVNTYGTSAPSAVRRALVG
jgi:subtilisin family serine protease